MQHLHRRRLRFLAALCVSIVLAASSNAEAIDFKLHGDPARLDITESMFLIAHLDPGDGDPSSANYGEFISRLNLQLTWGKWLLGMRVDSSDYVHTPQVGDTLAKPNCNEATMNGCVGTVYPNQLTNRFEQNPIDPQKGFEKLFLTYSSKYVTATLGDSYVSFGRGLVLSLRKLDELGLDTTLEGAKVDVHAGNFDLTAVGGLTNTQNLEEQTSRYWADPDDPIVGVQGQYRIANKVIVSLRGAGGKTAMPYSIASISRNDHYLRYGGSIEAPRPLPWLSLYGEYAHAQDVISGAISSGNAYYGAATIFAGKTTWAAEFKSYTNFQPWTTNSKVNQEGAVVYNAPPTLERVITELTENSDITSGRLRTDLAISPSLDFYLSPELGTLHPTSLSTDSLVDLYGGAEVRWNDGRSHAFPLVDWRMERTEVPGQGGLPFVGAGTLEERLFALEGEVVQALPKTFSGELTWLVWFRNKPFESPQPWVEGQVYLALKSTPRYEITAGYEFTTAEKEALNQHNFFNASFLWYFTPSTSLKLFAGGERAGLKCVSGICRYFPSFQGVRLEFMARG